MMDTMICWIAIVVVLVFVLILCRRYLGRILIILLALAMIGGILYLINPQGSTEIWNKVQTFTAFEKSELLNNVKGFLAKHPGSVFTTGISSHKYFLDKNTVPTNAYQINDRRYFAGRNSKRPTIAPL